MRKVDKKLIFINLVNGVYVPHVANAFHLTEEEVLQAFSFVLQKIKSYCFERRYPPLIVNNVPQAIKQKHLMLDIVEKINVEKAPLYRSITHKPLAGQDDIRKLR